MGWTPAARAFGVALQGVSIDAALTAVGLAVVMSVPLIAVRENPFVICDKYLSLPEHLLPAGSVFRAFHLLFHLSFTTILWPYFTDRDAET